MNARRHPRSLTEAFGPYGYPSSRATTFSGPYRRRGSGRIRGWLLAVAIGMALGAVIAGGF